MCCMIIKMFAKWRAQHSHNADKGVPSLAPFPFYSFRFGWVRFGSVQFSSVCWLFGFGAALVVFAFVAIVVVATGSDLALFALQSSPPTQRQLLLATCCLLLLLLFLRTMEICMFPITALKSQPNSYNNNYGTIESCLLLMITIIIIIVLNDGPQSVLSVSRVLMPLLLLPSTANAVLQCKYSHRKWKYSWVHAEYKTKGWQKTQT